VRASFHVDLVGADVCMTGEPEPVPPLEQVEMMDIHQHGYRAYHHRMPHSIGSKQGLLLAEWAARRPILYPLLARLSARAPAAINIGGEVRR
jgi:hypothetical protein